MAQGQRAARFFSFMNKQFMKIQKQKKNYYHPKNRIQ